MGTFTTGVRRLALSMSAPTVAAASSTELSVTFTLPTPSESDRTIDLRHSPDGSTWTTVTGVTSPATISGLTADTLYYVQTREIVSTHTAGAWSASGSATTDAAAVSEAGMRFADVEPFSAVAGSKRMLVEGKTGNLLVMTATLDNSSPAGVTFNGVAPSTLGWELQPGGATYAGIKRNFAGAYTYVWLNKLSAPLPRQVIRVGNVNEAQFINLGLQTKDAWLFADSDQNLSSGNPTIRTVGGSIVQGKANGLICVFSNLSLPVATVSPDITANNEVNVAKGDRPETGALFAQANFPVLVFKHGPSDGNMEVASATVTGGNAARGHAVLVTTPDTVSVEETFLDGDYARVVADGATKARTHTTSTIKWEGNTVEWTLSAAAKIGHMARSGPRGPGNLYLGEIFMVQTPGSPWSITAMTPAPDGTGSSNSATTVAAGRKINGFWVQPKGVRSGAGGGTPWDSLNTGLGKAYDASEDTALPYTPAVGDVIYASVSQMDAATASADNNKFRTRFLYRVFIVDAVPDLDQLPPAGVWRWGVDSPPVTKRADFAAVTEFSDTGVGGTKPRREPWPKDFLRFQWTSGSPNLFNMETSNENGQFYGTGTIQQDDKAFLLAVWQQADPWLKAGALDNLFMAGAEVYGVDVSMEAQGFATRFESDGGQMAGRSLRLAAYAHLSGVADALSRVALPCDSEIFGFVSAARVAACAGGSWTPNTTGGTSTAPFVTGMDHATKPMPDVFHPSYDEESEVLLSNAHNQTGYKDQQLTVSGPGQLFLLGNGLDAQWPSAAMFDVARWRAIVARDGGAAHPYINLAGTNRFSYASGTYGTPTGVISATSFGGLMYWQHIASLHSF
jgi:hypothetical protein